MTWRTFLLAVLGSLGSIGLLTIVLTIRWFVSPQSATPSEGVDAVVVLAGGDGERLARGLELMDEGLADVLVLSVGNRRWAAYPDIEVLCTEPSDFEVVCVEAALDTTKGEAMAISALAHERRWESIALVTSRYHLHRSKVRFEFCFDGAVHPVAAPADLTMQRLIHEWGGTLEAELLDRGCPETNPPT